jgi:hypothetical protein
MSRKIIIIEFTAHEAYLKSIVKLLPNDEVTIFVSDYFVHELMKDPHHFKSCNIIVKKKGEKYKDFFYANRKTIKKSDAVFINTLSRVYLDFYKYIDVSKIILTVHNAKSFLNICDISYSKYKSHNYIDNKNRIVQYLTYFIKSSLLRRADREVINKLWPFTHSLVVYNEAISNYIKSKLGDVNIGILPFGISPTKNHLPEFNHNNVQLAIIGNITNRRKDYIGIIDAIDTSLLEGPVVLNIIGSYANDNMKKAINDRISLISNKMFTVRKHGGHTRVSQAEANKILASVDYLLAATQKEIVVGCSIEEYGKTKASGCEYDAQGYNRILLNSSEFNLSKGLESFTLQYNNYNEMVSIINKSFSKDFVKNIYEKIEFDYDEYLSSSKQSLEKLLAGL